jgi:non-ribosomal peptide synthase protein (TIGR01720 family)
VPGTDLSRTVGWFTSVYPVRLDPGAFDGADLRAGGPAAGQVLKRVKEQLRAVPDDGFGFGLLRYLNPATAGRLAALASPPFGFNYLGRIAAGGSGPAAADWDVVAELGGIVDGQPERLPMAHAVELTAFTHDGAGGPRLVANWTWASGLLTEDSVTRLAAAWSRALEALAEHARRPDAGGWTPSDVALAGLSQDEIDQLETEWRTAQ